MSLVNSDLNQEKASTALAKSDKAKVTSPLAELKNGKVFFKQKPISFENLSETMQEIVSFRDCIKDLDYPLSMIPENHLPLIAKLVHESDKSVITLAKTLQSLLLPPSLEPSSQASETEAPGRLAPCVVEHAIKTVAERVNYGIGSDIEKPPAALCVWRWEVKNKDWLPKSMSDRVCQRFQERVAAKCHLQSMFDALPNDVRDAMLQRGKNKSPKGKETATDPPNPEGADALQEDRKRHTSETRDSSSKAGRPKKPVDPETVAKEKERQEKKAIKAEKEKKVAEAAKKSAAAFANFFRPTASKLNQPSNAAQTNPSASTQANLSEFQLTFKSFVARKDACLAPVNYFVSEKQKKGTKKDESVIELDSEGTVVKMVTEQSTPMEAEGEVEDVSHMSAQEVLRSFVKSQPPSLHPISRTLVARRSFKTEHIHCVRKIMHQLNDAEVQGDQRTTRKLTTLLRNRQKLPAKVIFFHENNRPGYLGTWTRSSLAIGPRTPFARDLLTFDYDHDSDAEWGEEEEEGGVDDVESLNESVEDDPFSTDSDMGDWLVEGDEIEIDPANTSDEPVAPANTSVKRRSTSRNASPNKKRKVVPLIPFQKGPVWEKEVGECEYESFKPMRIQLFNDAPFPIDPFIYVAEPAILEKANNPATKDSVGSFAIPALPERFLPKDASSRDDSVVKRKALSSVLPPKTSFPDEHVPLLLQKIDDSITNSFVVLLDSIFQDLRPLGIKKNALEVKLREVSEKDKGKKAWVVKEQAWIRHGLIKPT